MEVLVVKLVLAFGAFPAPSHKVSSPISWIHTDIRNNCNISIHFYILVARHIYGYTKIFDGDGDIERGDNYAHTVWLMGICVNYLFSSDDCSYQSRLLNYLLWSLVDRSDQLILQWEQAFFKRKKV